MKEDKNTNEEKELPGKEGFGMYIHMITNKSDEQINVIVRENGRDDVYAVGPGKKKGSHFPLPWVNKLQNSWKCILINSNSNSDVEMALWDDNDAKAYYNETGKSWLPASRAKSISSGFGWGDFELIIEKDLSLNMIKFTK